MRFYLDEDQPVRVAAIARARGIDVVATEELGRKGASDESQLVFATEQGRVMVTRNYRDFERLTGQFMRQGRPHAGVLFVSSSFAQNDYAGLAEALLRYDREHPAGMPSYGVDYLVPARRRSR